jgi:hypothetical protein
MVTEHLNVKQEKPTGLGMLLVRLQALNDANSTPAADVFELEYFYDMRWVTPAPSDFQDDHTLRLTYQQYQFHGVAHYNCIISNKVCTRTLGACPLSGNLLARMCSMPYRFPRDASRQRQVLYFCTHRDLLQPTPLVD